MDELRKMVMLGKNEGEKKEKTQIDGSECGMPLEML